MHNEKYIKHFGSLNTSLILLLDQIFADKQK